MPKPEDRKYAKESKPLTTEEKCHYAMELIDSGHDSKKEWEFLKALNNELHRRKKKGKLGKRGKSLLKLIAPVINKYANQDGKKVTQDPSLAHL